MSEFGNYLRSVLDDKTPISEHAKRLGIHAAMLSRFINGERKSCNLTTLEKLCNRISVQREVQAGLLAAYLRTQRVGSAKDLVEVTVRSGFGRIKEQPSRKSGDTDLSETVYKAHLDNKTSKSLTKVIKALPQSSALRKTIHNLADISVNLSADGIT